MANIAQMVNVLQAMILTQGDKIVLTPTYHVFEMMRVHQGATSVPLEVESPNLPGTAERIPTVSASASRAAGGRIHLSLVNTDPDAQATVACSVVGALPRGVSGRILTAPEMTSHNTFDAPHAVEPAPFGGATLSGSELSVALPPMSVVVLEL
jgi:alpha-N-arabinofuranosidase